MICLPILEIILKPSRSSSTHWRGKDRDGNTIENKIVAGARLSGNLSKIRLGILNMQTEEDVANGITANNNTVFSLQQKMFSRSYLGFIFVNRQQTGNPEFETDQDEFNRVVGLDYTLFQKTTNGREEVYSPGHFGKR